MSATCNFVPLSSSCWKFFPWAIIRWNICCFSHLKKIICIILKWSLTLSLTNKKKHWILFIKKNIRHHVHSWKKGSVEVYQNNLKDELGVDITKWEGKFFETKNNPASSTIFWSVYFVYKLLREKKLFSSWLFHNCVLLSLIFSGNGFHSETNVLRKHLRKNSELVLRLKYSLFNVLCLLNSAVAKYNFPFKSCYH